MDLMITVFATIWEMMATTGFSINDVFVSIKDVFIFSIIGGLFVWFLSLLLGGE